MPFDCTYRAQHGAAACLTACPASADGGVFSFARVERAGDHPPVSPRVVDIALLDMHHGWENLGHEALVHAMQTDACDLRPHLEQLDLRVRVISYDVRRSLAIPEAPGGRHAIYVGTGGPGHLDPRQNDGREGSQGIVEDGSWEAPVFGLFDAIRADPGASLFGVCHTFGVMCRWLGVADAVLRGPEKGKSAGIVHNVLSDGSRQHPWFSRFARALGPDRRFPVLDNRLYDLLPTDAPADDVRLLALECDEDGDPGEAVTMVEAARTVDGQIPRILGVNHHPEIVNRQRQLQLLEKKRARGGVDEAWLAERLSALTQPVDDDVDDHRLYLTSSYTLLGPLRAALHREVVRRAESLGLDPGFDAGALPLVYTADHAGVPPR